MIEPAIVAERKRSRGYCFTINNHTYEDMDDVLAIEAKYIVVGFEVGDDGTPHIQGYVYFDNPRDFGSVKRMLPRAHIEAQWGTCLQASDYCKEDGDWYEFGELPRQGRRTDIELVKEDLETMSLNEVAQTHFKEFMRYSKSMKEYKFLIMGDREDAPIVEWVYGPTGVGKTRYAVSKSLSVYLKDSTQWWDGYEQQDVIVIDDFDRKWPFRDLLKLLDRYPYQGQTKGGYVKINSDCIVITCDRPMAELYSGYISEHEYMQLKRRITREIRIGQGGIIMAPQPVYQFVSNDD